MASSRGALVTVGQVRKQCILGNDWSDDVDAQSVSVFLSAGVL